MNEKLIEETKNKFINSMTWKQETSQETKELVIDNVKGFNNYLINELRKRSEKSKTQKALVLAYTFLNDHYIMGNIFQLGRDQERKAIIDTIKEAWKEANIF